MRCIAPSFLVAAPSLSPPTMNSRLQSTVPRAGPGSKPGPDPRELPRVPAGAILAGKTVSATDLVGLVQARLVELAEKVFAFVEAAKKVLAAPKDAARQRLQWWLAEFLLTLRRTIQDHLLTLGACTIAHECFRAVHSGAGREREPRQAG
jgi:hypothetical protein